jgi:hypothetical protein
LYGTGDDHRWRFGRKNDVWNPDIPLDVIQPVVQTARVAHTPEAERALADLRRTHERFKHVEVERREAIVAASNAGCALRDISEAVDRDLSHEVIRGIVGPRAGVAFDWQGELFQLSEPQTRALIYKADGYGRNAFPGDVEKLDAGTTWLSGAADLALAMRQVHTGIAIEPIALDEALGFALFQILRLTYMTGMTRIADLRAALHAHFGRPVPLRRGREVMAS